MRGLGHGQATKGLQMGLGDEIDGMLKYRKVEIGKRYPDPGIPVHLSLPDDAIIELAYRRIEGLEQAVLRLTEELNAIKLKEGD